MSYSPYVNMSHVDVASTITQTYQNFEWAHFVDIASWWLLFLSLIICEIAHWFVLWVVFRIFSIALKSWNTIVQPVLSTCIRRFCYLIAFTLYLISEIRYQNIRLCAWSSNLLFSTRPVAWISSDEVNVLFEKSRWDRVWSIFFLVCLSQSFHLMLDAFLLVLGVWLNAEILPTPLSLLLLSPHLLLYLMRCHHDLFLRFHLWITICIIVDLRRLIDGLIFGLNHVFIRSSFSQTSPLRTLLLINLTILW